MYNSLGEFMKTIKENFEQLYIINKSKFIVKLFKVNDIDEIKNIINLLKNEYKDATHHCFAYIVNNQKKASDDGEPSGTAGLPILNILEKYELTNILCIVIRYFGGIKLGAGGLIRAYSNVTKETLNLANIIEYYKEINISIEFPYDNLKEVKYLLKDENIIEEIYNNTVTFKVSIKEDNIDDFINMCNKYNIKISRMI